MHLLICHFVKSSNDPLQALSSLELLERMKRGKNKDGGGGGAGKKQHPECEKVEDDDNDDALLVAAMTLSLGGDTGDDDGGKLPRRNLTAATSSEVGTGGAHYLIEM